MRASASSAALRAPLFSSEQTFGRFTSIVITRLSVPEGSALLAAAQSSIVSGEKSEGLHADLDEEQTIDAAQPG